MRGGMYASTIRLQISNTHIFYLIDGTIKATSRLWIILIYVYVYVYVACVFPISTHLHQERLSQPGPEEKISPIFQGCETVGPTWFFKETVLIDSLAFQDKNLFAKDNFS